MAATNGAPFGAPLTPGGPWWASVPNVDVVDGDLVDAVRRFLVAAMAVPAEEYQLP